MIRASTRLLSAGVAAALVLGGTATLGAAAAPASAAAACQDGAEATQLRAGLRVVLPLEVRA